MISKVFRSFSSFKEPVSAGTHALGAFLALAGTIVLVSRAPAHNEYIITGLIYGISLVALFLASTLVHGLRCSPETECFLEKCDYAAIYLLIAGTYTPVCLLAIKGSLGFYLLLTEWVMAIIGVTITFSRGWGPKILQVPLFLAMGWLFVIAYKTMSAGLTPALMSWLVAGGLFYSVGAVIFLLDRPHPWPGKISAHDVWHVLVLGGSACHFIMVAGLMG